MEDEIQSLKHEVVDLRNENKLLRDAIDGNFPRDLWWLLTKLYNQRTAINAIQRRGKGHTKEEREAMASAAA